MNIRVLNLIATLGHGRGGHFYDLINITNEISKSINVLTINIGKNESEVLNNASIPLINIKFRLLSSVSNIFKINKIIKDYKITHVNCYDLNSFALGLIFNLFNKNIYLIYTKCGGPNPAGYYPSISNLILMSKENFDFFEKITLFNQNKILIPNRVSSVNEDPTRLLKLKLKIKNTNKNLLRISRITSHYRSTLIQMVNIHNYLCNLGLEVNLILIGVIEDFELLEEIKSLSRFQDLFYIFTSDEFTRNASELIPIADIILGTGRGVMEASYFKKYILVPNAFGDYPILLNEDNFEELFSYNFSPRGWVKAYDENQNLNQIELIIKSNKDDYQLFIGKVWEDWFSIEGSKKKYLKFFNQCIPQPTHTYDLLRLSAAALKKLI